MPTRYLALGLGIALIAGIVALAMNEPDTSLLATDSLLFGTIEIDGSSTVFPITQAVAEEPAISSVTLGSYTNQIGEPRDENTATSALRFVCPFH